MSRIVTLAAVSVIAAASCWAAEPQPPEYPGENSETKRVTITVDAPPPPPAPPVFEKSPPEPAPPTIRIYTIDGKILDIPISVVKGPAMTKAQLEAKYQVGDIVKGAPAVPTTDVNYGHYGPLDGGVPPKR